MLVYTMPVWATLLAWPLSGQRPNARASVGLPLRMVGLWSLLGTRSAALSADMLVGAGFALASALLFAFGTVALRPLAELAPPPNLAWQLALGCLPMVLIGVVWEHPQLGEAHRTGWLLMAYGATRELEFRRSTETPLMPHADSSARTDQPINVGDLLRMPAVSRHTGLCRSTIYRLMATRHFPIPVKLAGRAVGWGKSEVDRWTQSPPPVAH